VSLGYWLGAFRSLPTKRSAETWSSNQIAGSLDIILAQCVDQLLPETVQGGCLPE